MKLPITVALLATLAATSRARADSPRRPTASVVYSADKKLKLSITPAGAGRQHHEVTSLVLTEAATGKQRYKIDLDPIDPDAMVSNGGYVALFTWAGSASDDRAVVLLGPGGKKIRALAPKDFMTPSEIRLGGRTTSHFDWEAVDYATGARPHRFDETKRHLILGVAKGGQRRPTEPNPGAIERRIDLATGALVGGPDLRVKTVEELVAAYRSARGPARATVLEDLQFLHPQEPEARPLWRSVAVDASAPPGERQTALAELVRKPTAEDYPTFRAVLFDEKALGYLRSSALSGLSEGLEPGELIQLRTWVETPGHPVALNAARLLLARRDAASLDPAIKLYRALPEAERARDDLLQQLVKASDARDDVLNLVLEADTNFSPYRVFEDLKKGPAAKAQAVAVKLLDSKSHHVRGEADRLLVEGLRLANPQRKENFETLLKAFGDPGSPVSRSITIGWTLAVMLIDRNRPADAETVITRTSALVEPKVSRFDELNNPQVTALAMRAYIEWLRGKPDLCLAHARKLAKLPGTGCRPNWYTSSESFWECRSEPVARLAAELEVRCSGPFWATCSVGEGAKVSIQLTNVSGEAVDNATLGAELVWTTGGEYFVGGGNRLTCTGQPVSVPVGGTVDTSCLTQPPRLFGSKDWPLRTEVEISLYSRDPKKGHVRPTFWCTAFVSN